MNKFKKYAALFAVLALMPFTLYAQEESNSSSDLDYYGAYGKCEDKSYERHGDDSEEVREAYVKRCMRKAGFESHMGDEEESSEDSSGDSYESESRL